MRRFHPLMAVLLLACMAPAQAQFSQDFPPYPGDPAGRMATVSVRAHGDALRFYELDSTAPQRDGAVQWRQVQETAGSPQLRTGNLLFDALFAQAIDDARLDSVEQIRASAYDGGQPIACHCFQTGEKWTYVWTRDLSYAADLGLALLDPQRTGQSLVFKISPFRKGFAVPPGLPADSWQIVQDTGSGGSWPVSSDRTAWALGAHAVLDTLEGPVRRAFASQAYAALRGTVEADRAAIFDPRDGLYTGEQSFLDWRDQTYAPYVLDDLVQLAQSKALSTNVLQYRALRLAAQLAAQQDAGADAQRYARWADALRVAINRSFWVPEAGLYASILTPDPTAAPVARYDLLGESLAVLSGIADPARAREVLAHYPHAPFGAPVTYPQQPNIPVYHNRAIWPFVTAYELQAAARAGNVAVADNAFDALVRSAALHLTNTENLEWLTGQSQYDDGPVINSPRQIWSVAAYVSLVARTVFGVQPDGGGLRIDPFLTAHMRSVLGGSTATLTGLQVHGRRLTVILHLPRPEPAGRHGVVRMALNGRRLHGFVPIEELEPESRIEVFFGAAQAADTRIRKLPDVNPASHDDPAVFAPEVPLAVLSQATDGRVRIGLPATAPAFQVWRDGALLTRTAAAPGWEDPDVPGPALRHCYRVVAVNRAGNASHPTLPRCVGGAPQRLPWQAGTAAFTVAQDGNYALWLSYDNHHFAINTGITNAVKRLELIDARGRRAAGGIVQMPHIQPLGETHPVRQSTELRLHLAAGSYVVRLTDYFNMSALESNARYSHAGGADGPLNDAAVGALVVSRIP